MENGRILAISDQSIQSRGQQSIEKGWNPSLCGEF